MTTIDRLAARRNADGGFGPIAGAPSEPEPTALAAMALDDGAAAAWLEERQADDGSVGTRAGQVFRDVTALACLAMRSPEAVALGLGWVRGSQARSEASNDALPHDPDARGWGWTTDTFGWVEPTAWAVLCLRAAGDEGDEGASVADGIAMLADRECVGGGWNYGNRIVLAEALPPFVQTTALALIALHGLEVPMVSRGLSWLRSNWQTESDGVLSAAVSAAALARFGAPEAGEAANVVAQRLATVRAPDTIALAWTGLMTGHGLAALAVSA